MLENVEALVNTVNCVGVMGKGIALQFKQAYPENFRQYEKACRAKKVQPGRMFTVATGNILNPKYIINFPTKRHWKGNSKIDDIKSGLVAIVAEVQVHWVVTKEINPAQDSEQAITLVQEWNERKRNLFKHQHIRKAWQRLQEQNWLNIEIRFDF